jgi:RNA polymerase sigma-70 factor (ECF subfamily)
MDKLHQIAPEVSADAPSAPSDPALRRALADLSPELRECVALRFFADLPLDEIAAAQGIPVGTVKSRLHGAMKHLRGTLTEGGFQRDG